MKTAILVRDGMTQIVLTPESDFEKNALGMVKDKPAELSVLTGEFFTCRGGWERFDGNHTEDWNLILRIGGQS